ncbi:TPA: hypothetical protein ACG0AB_001584 [Elizabethkingia anophelis]|nr:hypothetical protein [Elizabethkingia sp. M8]MCT3673993.1 hypothetical protein [Elizabethkingia anophelis]MCT3681477.1 hypothetical protein [Elizabethkingia anophelis]MCT3701904.1 hypothetical protein [Elizabethkingia anophelis]MCT3770981.1 hypothetical protein [Elizabethkingia anophelis]MCT3781269.1 hypothetical protein [Elizabethkingia anophelis]
MIEKMKGKTQKSEYVSPDIRVFVVEMEQGIAAGSARVVPPNNGGVVQEEWIQGDDDNRTIEW